MTLCPIAIVAGCRKCPAFSACPLKTVLGDHREPDETRPMQRVRPETPKDEPPK